MIPNVPSSYDRTPSCHVLHVLFACRFFPIDTKDRNSSTSTKRRRHPPPPPRRLHRRPPRHPRHRHQIMPCGPPLHEGSLPPLLLAAGNTHTCSPSHTSHAPSVTITTPFYSL